ncbi:hypothetical protein [Alkalimarinus coralli]|uniref:hypothetical protein n=1 Tax=Alkalimarinus coralli TaxID=2935863 RepID=UPI00202AF575|nr:hypothetical protein [Alkalimarinus coralli]
MKKTILALAIGTLPLSVHAKNNAKVYDAASLQAAISAANQDSSINKIVFKKNATISPMAPVIYSGTQPLTIVGNGATINGENAGQFELVVDNNGMEAAVTEDGTLVFNTMADITIKNLTVENSATRGIVVNVPEDAQGSDISITLKHVNIISSALYGLHIDDNADAFDDGASGSSIGIDLEIYGSNFIGNGTGALDFDGIRVDERSEGDISSWIVKSHIDGNGGDGIELDEAGSGSVFSTMHNVTVNNNGFYNEEDLDDGFDIDEAGDGSILVNLYRVEANNNMDEGLDFDESGNGRLSITARRVVAENNSDEGIKADEEDAGDIGVNLVKVKVLASGDDGIQLTELGEGNISGFLNKVFVSDSKKYGIKAEQWVNEDEAEILEPAGFLKAKNVRLEGNGKGDEIKVHNISVN